MTTWQKLAAGSALLLAALPAPLLARRHSYRADPGPRDPAAVLIEDPSASDPAENYTKLSAEKSGVIPTKDGRSLRVNVELGNVRVFTDESAQISYRAIVEADSRDPGAEEFLKQSNFSARQTHWGVALDGKVPWQGLRGRFNATIEIHIPRRYNLEVSTGGGNIEVQDIDGRIRLTSAGGNINVGRVGGADASVVDAARNKGDRLKPVLLEAARIDTQGGHITVGDVSGTLRASTSGGHITAGNISGDAVLRTGGGQIFARNIAGTAALDSGGGNIHIEGAGSSVTADTAGGGIVLRQADAPLRVSANHGGITAWLSDLPGPKTAGDTVAQKLRQASQLSSTSGDIVLYIPRKLAASIDAIVEQGSGHRIATDPSLPFKINCHDSVNAARTIHCDGLLNGGGERFQLKAVSGNIALRLGDPEMESSAASPAGWMRGGLTPAALEPLTSSDGDDFTDADGFFAEMRRRILESWWGGIPVDADEMQKHIERSVAPVYPEVARQAGVEGDVVLRVYVSSSGRVTDLKVLDGPPILARAAVEAVQQWQYQAPRMNGRPANVVTTLVVSFRLH
ncbi:MAG: TonB family protein [Candidatus Acidiferrales bacterium]